jgi:hypothetical protein
LEQAVVGRRQEFVGTLFVALTIQIGGCASLRLPAIDPTGEGIFLPWPQSTTLNTSQGYPARPRSEHPIGRALHLPAGIFKSAETPPQCPEDLVPPNEATARLQAAPEEVAHAQPSVPRVMAPGCFNGLNNEPCPHGGPDQIPQGRVTLRPRQIVACVGTEVILVGGVCDADGYYRTREPVEWSLESGSVGTFAEPGGTVQGRLGHRYRLGGIFSEPPPELLCNNYALGCTSKRIQVLTRGTPDPSDDLFVLDGQTWIGVTSAREGNSYVTLFAPDLDGPKDRQASAVIHWVDGQWILPPPVFSDSASPQTLTTTVSRQLTRQPIAGWIVRYEITGGAPATFDAGGQIREVITDSAGRGTVQILPGTNQPGTTQVRIQIIRPSTGRGEPDRLIIGQGFTSVTWNTAKLEIRVEGPPSIELDQEARFHVEVHNPGTAAGHDVVVMVMIPAGIEYLSSQPAAEVRGQALHWNLGTIQPGQRQSMDITYRAEQSGSVRLCASVRASNSPTVEDCLTTQVQDRALYIEMFGPREDVPIEVGELAQYEITVTNRGSRRLTDVLVVDRFDEGLLHRTLSPGDQQDDSAGPLERTIGELEPGQSVSFALNLVVVQPGRHCHTLDATAANAAPATVTACVNGIERRRADLRVLISGPNEVVAGRDTPPFDILIENTGDGPISNLQVIVDHDSSLEPIAATPEARTDRNRVIWFVQGPIEPGQSATVRVQYRAVFAVERAPLQVLVTGPDGLQRSDRMELAILQGPDEQTRAGEPQEPDGMDRELDNLPANAANRNSVPESGQPETGGLQLSIEARTDRRIERGQAQRIVDFIFIIRNNDTAYDSDVQLTVTLSNKVTFVPPYTGPTRALNPSADWRRIPMSPIETLRAGEETSYTVRARIDEPGEIITRAEVSSLRNPAPVIRENRLVAAP